MSILIGSLIILLVVLLIFFIISFIIHSVNKTVSKKKTLIQTFWSIIDKPLWILGLYGGILAIMCIIYPLLSDETDTKTVGVDVSIKQEKDESITTEEKISDVESENKTEDTIEYITETTILESTTQQITEKINILPPIVNSPQIEPPFPIDLDIINFTSSGICGQSTYWKYGESILYIYGTGAMFNYNGTTFTPPWYDVRNQVIAVVIEDGITNIGKYSFAECVKLEYMEIPITVEIIDSNSFRDCRSLKLFVIPDTVKTIGASAFINCTSLEEIYISESVVEIDSYAFRGCSLLKSIILPESVSEIGNFILADCSKLKEVHILSKILLIVADDIKNASPNLIIYCYENSTADICFKSGNTQIKYYTQ